MRSSQFTPALGQFEEQSEVGHVNLPGACQFDAGQQTYCISGEGANIWGEQDAFHFVWKHIKGNFIVTMQAAFQRMAGNPHRKLGWMARANLNANSAHLSTVIHGDGLVSLQFRRHQGGITEEVQAALTHAEIVQLERRDNTYSMSVAHFGEPFVTVQTDEIDLGEEIYIGLFVCSHDERVVEQAIFRNVRIVVPVNAGFERGRDALGSHLELLEAASGQRRIIFSSDTVVEAPNWTKDGKALIYNKDGRLYRFDLKTEISNLIDTGEVVRNNNDHVLSFDGSNLGISSHAEADNLSRVYIVPAQGGRPKLITSKGPSYLHGWSPDGKYLVYTGQRNGQFDIYRIPFEGGEELQMTDTPGLEDGPEYTPDGKYIYFNSVRTGSMQIWRMRADGSEQEQITEDEYNNWFPHISPDGKWVVFLTYLAGEVAPSDHPAARRVYLRRIPLEGGTSTVLAYLYGGQGTMNVPAWSPDGSQLAFVSNTVPFR